MNESGIVGDIGYGIIQIPTSKDEDRCSFKLSDGNSAPSGISSLGLFDGHDGRFGSKLCSEEFHDMVFLEYITALQQDENKLDLTDDEVDVLLCQCIRKVIEDLNSLIMKESNSGTTLVSIFILNRKDGSKRIICPWVGDSRCVKYHYSPQKKYVESVIMTEDHVPSLRREFNRVINRTEAPWTSKPIDIETQPFILAQNQAVDDIEICFSKEYHKHDIVSRLDEINSSLNNGEDFEVTDTSKVGAIASIILPKCQTKLMNGSSKSSAIDRSSSYSGLLELAEISPTIESETNCTAEEDSMPASPDPTTKLVTFIGLGSGKSSNDDNVARKQLARLDTSNDIDDQDDVLEIVNETSFIARRVHPITLKRTGPLCVFSRHDVSLCMTRSIGDRWGPRSCIAQPDITAVTISPQQHARFVLASDGLWDVLSVERVRSLVFRDKDPRHVANRLVTLAWNLRRSTGIRKDDISAIVVDVFPDNLVTVPWFSCSRCRLS